MMTQNLNYSREEIADLMKYLTKEEREEIERISKAHKQIWYPLPGPQAQAYYSTADVVGYGGAAGGGKTDLMLGKAVNDHRRVKIFRREGTQFKGIIDRLTGILKTRDGLSAQNKEWRIPSRNLTIALGSMPNLGDEEAHQGDPYDLMGFDELTHFLEHQFRFVQAWNRTAIPGQRCQIIATMNPPTTAEGRWVIDYFAPWLDPKYPNPAKPGELRYFYTNPNAKVSSTDSKDVAVPDGTHFVFGKNGERVYDFDPAMYREDQIIKPKSRTFIFAKVADNPHLMRDSNYMATLQGLPEPLRSKFLLGDFQAGMQDDPWQVIPTAWVKAAQARWKPMSPIPPMDSIGVDCARGGDDNNVIYKRHGMWFDRAVVHPGQATPDGAKLASLIIAEMRDHAPMHIEIPGPGISALDFLVEARLDAHGINVGEHRPAGTDKTGLLQFLTKRSMLWWRMREAFDPANNTGIAIPPDDKQLEIDLCAPLWESRGPIIYVEGRAEIVKRIGRSPDWASALMLALIDTPKRRVVESVHNRRNMDYDPYKRMKDHDPYKIL